MGYWKSGGWLKEMPIELTLVISGLFCLGLVGGIVYAIIEALFF